MIVRNDRQTQNAYIQRFPPSSHPLRPQFPISHAIPFLPITTHGQMRLCRGVAAVQSHLTGAWGDEFPHKKKEK